MKSLDWQMPNKYCLTLLSQVKTGELQQSKGVAMSIHYKRDAKHKLIAAINKLHEQQMEDLYWANQPDWDEDRGNQYEGYNSTDELPYGGN
jgi:hypothetical protein